MNVLELQRKSIQYRRDILTMIRAANAGHTGGSLSCVDILNVLYNRVMNITPENFNRIGRDHYIQSKGHSVEALFAVLADKGFFPAEELQNLEHYGSRFVGHPTRDVPGIEHNTGALGHGLAVAVGLALAAKMDGRRDRVFVLLGDGELEEGSNWEASMSAAHYNLDNLVVIVDRNTLQISGRTEAVSSLEPLEARFNTFGYIVKRVNGHDVAALAALFERVPFKRGRPNLVLADTIKGRGISYIEDQVEWHHHVPTDQEYNIALAELQQAELALAA